jgi:hypothetical protein
MVTLIETWDLNQELQPAQSPDLARTDAIRFAPNITIKKGTAVGVKTSNRLGYAMVPGANDGTQNFVGFAKYSFATDANSLVYLGFNTTAAPFSAAANFRLSPQTTTPIWVTGIFDSQDVYTRGTSVAEVDTFTPATVTTGDVNTISYISPAGVATTVSFTIGGTQTAAAAVTGLAAAWNANATLTALGTTSGTGTLIITAANAGVPLNLVSSVVGTGTLTKALTTPPGMPYGEVDIFTPASPTTADVNTITYSGTPGAPQTITFTVGATQTVAAVIAGLIAAWNANPTLAALGYAANGGNYLMVVPVNAGNPLNLTSSVTGTGTLTKTASVAAVGRSIADIQVGRPGAYVLHNGFWFV